MKFGTFAFLLIASLVALGASLVQCSHLVSDISNYKNALHAHQAEIASLKGILAQVQSENNALQNHLNASVQEVQALKEAVENERATKAQVIAENQQLRDQSTQCAATNIASKDDHLPQVHLGQFSQSRLLVFESVVGFIGILLFSSVLIYQKRPKWRGQHGRKYRPTVRQAYLRPIDHTMSQQHKE